MTWHDMTVPLSDSKTVFLCQKLKTKQTSGSFWFKNKTNVFTSPKVRFVFRQLYRAIILVLINFATVPFELILLSVIYEPLASKLLPFSYKEQLFWVTNFSVHVSYLILILSVFILHLLCPIALEVIKMINLTGIYISVPLYAVG